MKDYLEGQTALQGYKIQSLRNENLKIESRKEDLRNQVVGCVIFAIIPLTFVLLHHLSVLLLPIWLLVFLWIIVLFLIFFGIYVHLEATRNKEKIQQNESKIDLLLGFSETEEPEDYINKLIELNVTRLEEYYDEVKRHSFLSFSFSLMVGVVGFLLIVTGIVLGYFGHGEKMNIAYLSGISGIITEFISGVFFYLYNRTVKQLKSYHNDLIDLQNTLLSFKLVEQVKDGPEKVKLMSNLIDYLIGKKIPVEKVEES
jgi:ABC-type multidrug transport system fused ATPase/permease subunit